MSKRLILILVLMALPLTAHAASDTAADPSSVAPQLPSALNQNQADPATSAAASSLGPSANTSNGSSNLSTTSLQPAGGSPLQSDPANSANIGSAGGSNLQAGVVSNDTLKVIQGDVDGPPHPATDDPQGVNWLWLGCSVLLALLVAAAYFVLRRHEQKAGY